VSAVRVSECCRSRCSAPVHLGLHSHAGRWWSARERVCVYVCMCVCTERECREGVQKERESVCAESGRECK
jgi:hypothetical protein